MKKFQYHMVRLLCCIVMLFPLSINAQKKTSVNQKSRSKRSALVKDHFYIAYPQKLMLRLFLSQKFVPFTISSKNFESLKYKTNSKLNLGIGATYRIYTLNLSYGFNFLNTDKGQGKTTGVDLQLHIYPYKCAIDLVGTFLKGYYLDPSDNNGLHLSNYYQRPDFRRNVAGVSIFYVPNGDKFSYKAAITQNEWQTRSAGSLLYGGEAYHGQIKGDSPLVPGQVSSNYEQSGINKISFINVGPGIGYGYTYVLDKNFFITASVIATACVNFSSEEKAGNKYNLVNLVPGVNYKGAIGYNSNTWSLSADLIGNRLYTGSSFASR